MTLSRSARHRQIRRVLWVTFLLNLVVVAAKLTVGLMSGALSVVAEGAHSSVDALNNILALSLARIAAQEPDELHPYGHAKFETLGALGMVAFLSITVFELVTRAVGRLFTGGSPHVDPLVIGVMVASAIVSALVSRFELRRGRELRSELLTADAKHTRSDLYASVAVLVGLGLVAMGYPWADPLFTLFVAFIIAHTGWEILQTTIPVLVDERAVDESVIRSAVLGVPGVLKCYDVRSRGRAGEVFIEVTIGVASDLGVEDAHEISDQVEDHLRRTQGAREVWVHVEPASGQ
ncbi:MAG TPA: cation diffusion facilitator family transporter [Longimicrobiaceae bacterium]|nr:cation diffusion facilitator family transporter [Longimicrobiaceae bacterium]